jgi:uncharacterized protein with HEPN domain
LLDALGAIDSAQEFLAGRTLQDYEQDKLRRSAVERQLEILGEACARLVRLDSSMLMMSPGVKLAIDLRNRIIHGYDAVDDEIVFLTVMEDLNPLKQLFSAQLVIRG